MDLVGVPPALSAVLLQTSPTATEVELSLLIILLVLLLTVSAWAFYTCWKQRKQALALQELLRATRQLTDGDLGQRLEITEPRQVAVIAKSINRMAEQLEDRLDTVMRQRNELEAVLRSMVEGVLVVDLDERVKSVNRAASYLLGLGEQNVVGRNVLELVRDISLKRFVTGVLASEVPIEDEIELEFLHRDDENSFVGMDAVESRLLQAQGAALRNSTGKRTGAVIVLHDVTRLRQLESVRRDFVANVSHEIKTPVTAVKAAVETVLDTPDASREEIEHFLRIVARQSDRLQAIIEDLLSLARIEQDRDNQRIELISTPVARSLEAAIESCQPKAKEKHIAIRIEADNDLYAKMNAPLFEQAVTNLVDNAIKYSPNDSEVWVRSYRRGAEAVVEVTDRGIGIAAEHLPRLFERFYRTDKARSRAMGGTGLGLAIVKHIVTAHEGRVAVESKPGEGSTFRVVLAASPSD